MRGPGEFKLSARGPEETIERRGSRKAPETMNRYVAFLRAINVGGHVVKMDVLRRLLESTGASNVETFIASGNVIFDSPHKAAELESGIEDHLHRNLGYRVATFLRSIAELQSVAALRPFSESDLEAATLYIAFLRKKPSAAPVARLVELRNEIDDFHVHKREVYWLCRKTFSESRFSGALLEKIVGSEATLRNSTTVRKIAAKYR